MNRHTAMLYYLLISNCIYYKAASLHFQSNQNLKKFPKRKKKTFLHVTTQRCVFVNLKFETFWGKEEPSWAIFSIEFYFINKLLLRQWNY